MTFFETIFPLVTPAFTFFLLFDWIATRIRQTTTDVIWTSPSCDVRGKETRSGKWTSPGRRSTQVNFYSPIRCFLYHFVQKKIIRCDKRHKTVKERPPSDDKIPQTGPWIFSTHKVAPLLITSSSRPVDYVFLISTKKGWWISRFRREIETLFGDF